MPVTIIGEDAFAGCSSIQSVVIPEGITEIRKWAFMDCHNLTNVYIPASISTIRDYVFVGCYALTGIDVNEYNTVFSSQDGVLFDKDKVSLICCPKGKIGKYTIPDGVEIIWDSAFSWCQYLTEIEIPNSVNSIGDDSFFRCLGLTNMVIPESVEVIGGYSFYGCSNLHNITIPSSVVIIGYAAFIDCADDLVIYGESSSYAETYAENNGITFESTNYNPKEDFEYKL